MGARHFLAVRETLKTDEGGVIHQVIEACRYAEISVISLGGDLGRESQAPLGDSSRASLACRSASVTRCRS